MEDPMDCQYEWTFEEFLTANKQNRGHSRPVRQMSGILWAITLFLLLAGIVRPINRGFDKVSIMCLVVGIVLVALRFYYPRLFLRIYEKSPDRNTDIRWETSADRVVVETATAKTEYAWSRFTNFKRTDKGFLLYLQPGVYHWLPFHSFSKATDIERFNRLITNQIDQNSVMKVL